MTHYIDADKLIAEILKLRSESCISESDDYYEYAKSEIIDIIESLQQEQPEVDLEKEIDAYFDKIGMPVFWCNDDEQRDFCAKIARHFYELGKNARKEK